MDNNTRFAQYVRALQQYTSRENHAEVPAQHVEILENSEIRLGAWVSYMRQRYKNSKLPAHYVEELIKITGWTWGPLRRGPRKKNERNAKILEMRSTGHSITQISDAFNISRQRVHQIVKNNDV
jgi:hypothetical protein